MPTLRRTPLRRALGGEVVERRVDLIHRRLHGLPSPARRLIQITRQGAENSCILPAPFIAFDRPPPHLTSAEVERSCTPGDRRFLRRRDKNGQTFRFHTGRLSLSHIQRWGMIPCLSSMPAAFGAAGWTAGVQGGGWTA